MISDAWEKRIPVYGRLPSESEAYYGNITCEALTSGLDQLLCQFKDALESIEEDWIDPDTCRQDVLDWRAEKEGLVIPGFWDFTWQPEIKRSLIKKASWLFLNKGRAEVIEWLIALFKIEARVYILGAARFDVDTFDSNPFGGIGDLEYYVLIPHLSEAGVFVSRESYNWRMIERILDNFSPIFTKSQVVYREARFDISRFDEPFLV